MSEIKHTPGPWFIEPMVDENGDHDGGGFEIATDPLSDKADVLCTRYPWHERAQEMMANARLIAAAPDLLAALRDCLTYLENDIGGPDFGGPERQSARAAITKATEGQQ